MGIEKLYTEKDVLRIIEECQVILITPRKKEDYIKGVNDFMIKLRQRFMTTKGFRKAVEEAGLKGTNFS